VVATGIAAPAMNIRPHSVKSPVEGRNHVLLMAFRIP
jgi:hypothetical protein